MAGRAANRSIVFVSELRRLFDLQLANFTQRKVETFKHDGSKACYLDEFLEKCSDLVAGRYQERALEATGKTLDQLKALESEQRIRKLTIENDEREGRLVDAAEVKIAYGKKITAMNAELDGAVSQIKMKHPDIPQSVLAMIEDCLIDARNAAAAHRLEK